MRSPLRCAQTRNLRKKLQQVDALAARAGASLDAQQRAKLATRPALADALERLAAGAPLAAVQALLGAAHAGALRTTCQGLGLGLSYPISCVKACGLQAALQASARLWAHAPLPPWVRRRPRVRVLGLGVSLVAYLCLVTRGPRRAGADAGGKDGGDLASPGSSLPARQLSTPSPGAASGALASPNPGSSSGGRRRRRAPAASARTGGAGPADVAVEAANGGLSTSAPAAAHAPSAPEPCAALRDAAGAGAPRPHLGPPAPAAAAAAPGPEPVARPVARGAWALRGPLPESVPSAELDGARAEERAPSRVAEAGDRADADGFVTPNRHKRQLRGPSPARPRGASPPGVRAASPPRGASPPAARLPPGRALAASPAVPAAHGWPAAAASAAPPARIGGFGAALAAPERASSGSGGGGGGSGRRSAGKQQRKGGLSMFLAGELERPALGPPTPPTAGEGGAAGGGPAPAPWALAGTGHAGGRGSGASLRDIQIQEAAAAAGATAAAAAPPPPPPGAAQAAQDEDSIAGAGLAVPLAHFVHKSAPIAVGRAAASPGPPAWGGPAGSSPPAYGRQGLAAGHSQGQGSGPGAGCRPAAASAQPSLRCIQAEQEQLRDTLSRSWGAAGASPGGRGGAGAGPLSQWRSQSSAVSAAPAPALGTSPGAHAGAGFGAGFPAGVSPPGGRPRSHGYSPTAAGQRWIRG